MEERLKAHVMSLFADAPKTKKMIEIREEILANVRERYQDLLASGATQEEAYDISIRSIGNLEEIMRSLEETDAAPAAELTPEEKERMRKRSMLDGFAVALYIISPIWLFICGLMDTDAAWVTGLVGLFVCIAAATGIKVYANGMYQTRYQKVDNSMMEEFKEWQSGRGEQERKMKTYEGILWPLIVAAYFILSFSTGAWYITWVIFIIGAAIQQLIRLLVVR